MTTEYVSALPNGWVCTTIGEIAERINSGFPSGKHNKEGRGVPQLRPMNINIKGEIQLTDLKYVESGDYDPLLKDDVLFNNTNSPKLLGKTASIKRDTNWAYSNHMTRIRLNRAFPNANWVSHYLHTLFIDGYFRMNCVHHVNQASVGQAFLAEKVHIPLPPLPEQYRIVAKIDELFTKLDAGVEALEEIKAQLKRYRQAILEHAVKGNLTEEWREAHKGELEPASVLLEQIKAERKRNGEDEYTEPPPADTSHLPAAPERWVWTKLANIVSGTQIGLVKSSAQQNNEGKGIAYVKMNNVTTDGRVVLDDLVYVPASAEEVSRYGLRKGDILFNTRNSVELVGKTGVVRTEVGNMIYNNNLMRIRTPRQVSPDFLGIQMYSPSFRERMEKVKRSTTNVAALYAKDVLPLGVLLAPINEQLKIVEEIESRVSIADEIEKVVERGLKLSERLRRSILKRAFEGKLVPQDLNDEPADKLLERIREDGEKQKANEKAGKRKNNRQLRMV